MILIIQVNSRRIQSLCDIQSTGGVSLKYYMSAYESGLTYASCFLHVVNLVIASGIYGSAGNLMHHEHTKLIGIGFSLFWIFV